MCTVGSEEIQERKAWNMKMLADSLPRKLNPFSSNHSGMLSYLHQASRQAGNSQNCLKTWKYLGKYVEPLRTEGRNRRKDFSRSLSYFKEFHQQLCALTGTWGLVELSLQLGAFCCVLCMKFWPHTDLFLNLWLPLTNKYLFACVCWRIFINHGYPETDKNLNCSRLSDKQGEKQERGCYR